MTDVGKRYGRLLVESAFFVPLTTVHSKSGIEYTYRSWRLNCRCDCGNETVVRRNHFRSGVVRSCGCLVVETSRRNMARLIRQTVTPARLRHGDTRGHAMTAEYGCWRNMKTRCENPRSTQWEYYGARGIRVCARWRDSFEAFLDDMGRRPSPLHSIDRIDPDGNYEPENVRWATAIQQRHNRRDSRVST